MYSPIFVQSGPKFHGDLSHAEKSGRKHNLQSELCKRLVIVSDGSSSLPNRTSGSISSSLNLWKGAREPRVLLVHHFTDGPPWPSRLSSYAPHERQSDWVAALRRNSMANRRLSKVPETRENTRLSLSQLRNVPTQSNIGSVSCSRDTSRYLRRGTAESK
jgi:hypothetical protein